MLGPCANSPCLNGASCQTVGNSFRCICQNGFTGLFCQDPLRKHWLHSGLQSNDIKMGKAIQETQVNLMLNRIQWEFQF